MIISRHIPKSFVEQNKDTCRYCRVTPSNWRYSDTEKICAHCGTRVYRSAPRLEKDTPVQYPPL